MSKCPAACAPRNFRCVRKLCPHSPILDYILHSSKRVNLVAIGTTPTRGTNCMRCQLKQTHSLSQSAFFTAFKNSSCPEPCAARVCGWSASVFVNNHVRQPSPLNFVLFIYFSVNFPASFILRPISMWSHWLSRHLCEATQTRCTCSV